MQPTISLCVIVRNEEKNLRACLGPVRRLVDEIIVVDTGSSDRTREIAAELGAQIYACRWSDDFSAARNECLRHATGDWVLWLDADERLDTENIDRLAAIREHLGDGHPDIYMARVYSPLATAESTGRWETQPRLFRRIAGLHWCRRVHEELTADDRRFRPIVHWTDLTIEHVGFGDPVRRSRKRRRDMRLLRREYALAPEDATTLFYLGWEHLELGHLPQALHFLRNALARSPHMRKLYALLSHALSCTDQKQEALAISNRGLIEFPDDPELLFQRGVLLSEMGNYNGAVQTLVRLVNLPSQHYQQLGVEDGLSEEKGRFMLGLTYYRMGRWSEADLQFRTAIRYNPRSPHAWTGLALLYLGAECWDRLQHALAQLRQCPESALFASVLESRWLLAKAEVGRTQDVLDAALARAPETLRSLALTHLIATGDGSGHETVVRINGGELIVSFPLSSGYSSAGMVALPEPRSSRKPSAEARPLAQHDHPPGLLSNYGDW